jgi:hypothetical protein
MKSKSEISITAPLAAYDDIAKWLLGFDALKAAKESELRTLEGECDLSDAPAVRKVGDLQIVCTLLPRKQLYMQEKLAQAAEELGKACDGEMNKKILPRLKAIEAAIRSKLAERMKQHFPAEPHLSNAIGSTAECQELNSFHRNMLRNRGLDKTEADYARRILMIADAMEVLAEKHGIS